MGMQTWQPEPSKIQVQVVYLWNIIKIMKREMFELYDFLKESKMLH